MLIDNANIWTCGPKGIVNEWDILFVNGKIDKVAPDISVPMGSALVIDGTNKYVTPGLIDCHSHSAASSINEGAQAVTAEVRMQDVLFADDINIYLSSKSEWPLQCSDYRDLHVGNRYKACTCNCSEDRYGGWYGLLCIFHIY